MGISRPATHSSTRSAMRCTAGILITGTKRKIVGAAVAIAAAMPPGTVQRGQR